MGPSDLAKWHKQQAQSQLAVYMYYETRTSRAGEWHNNVYSFLTHKKYATRCMLDPGMYLKDILDFHIAHQEVAKLMDDRGYAFKGDILFHTAAAELISGIISQGYQ